MKLKIEKVEKDEAAQNGGKRGINKPAVAQIICRKVFQK